MNTYNGILVMFDEMPKVHTGEMRASSINCTGKTKA